ncbi:methylenetetrahydrofolate reductase [Streptomyces sp. NPDC057474]|uniref:methylenetetrahydrofolate reductase n=1 Tax=Streptomyces sp. NPDC057474 TaxID=3346144 RepID=UPI0036CBA962
MTDSITGILKDFSVEMTAKDIDALHTARPYLPLGTRVNVTFLGSESPEARLAAVQAIKEHRFVPVPHLSARRLSSEAELEVFLRSLEAVGAGEHVFVVGGDPREPEGPYAEALDLITSAPLTGFGARTIGITGYPEGHPDIPQDVLWQALTAKASALADLGKTGDVITQFGFDVDAAISWIEDVRARGLDLPIRVGVPGPAGVKRLLSYARRFGVGSSAGIARKYGFSLTNLLSTAGPDRFIGALADRLDPAVHGIVKLHFYAFGGLRATAEWVRDFTADSQFALRADA